MERIPQIVSKAIRDIVPDARVVLFGSRARGNEHDESDWDFLILTDREATRSLKKEIRDALWEIEMEQEVVISSLIVTANTWNKTTEWPIHQNINRDGIVI